MKEYLINRSDTPAFPTKNYHGVQPIATGYSEGMTLRDYFAAKAMQGILTDAEIAMGISEIAELAYKYADAMMKAREA
jgi:hypothetical protein